MIYLFAGLGLFFLFSILPTWLAIRYGRRRPDFNAAYRGARVPDWLEYFSAQRHLEEQKLAEKQARAEQRAQRRKRVA